MSFRSWIQAKRLQMWPSFSLGLWVHLFFQTPLLEWVLCSRSNFFPFRQEWSWIWHFIALFLYTRSVPWALWLGRSNCYTVLVGSGYLISHFWLLTMSYHTFSSNFVHSATEFYRWKLSYNWRTLQRAFYVSTRISFKPHHVVFIKSRWGRWHYSFIWYSCFSRWLMCREKGGVSGVRLHHK